MLFLRYQNLTKDSLCSLGVFQELYPQVIQIEFWTVIFILCFVCFLFKSARFHTEQLGITMTLLFGRVSYVGIDTDPIYYYPKGAARVTFEKYESVVAAVKKRFLMPAETKTRKMVH